MFALLQDIRYAIRQLRRDRTVAVVVVLTIASACARQFADGGWNGIAWMHDFMGLFLVVFSMFKFFDMEGFADGFQMYDLLAKPFRPYAYVYPFIELALGLGYLAHWRAMQLRSTERRSHPWVSGSRARADLPLTTVVVHGRRRARRELVTAPK